MRKELYTSVMPRQDVFSGCAALATTCDKYQAALHSLKLCDHPAGTNGQGRACIVDLPASSMG